MVYELSDFIVLKPIQHVFGIRINWWEKSNSNTRIYWINEMTLTSEIWVSIKRTSKRQRKRYSLTSLDGLLIWQIYDFVTMWIGTCEYAFENCCLSLLPSFYYPLPIFFVHFTGFFIFYQNAFQWHWPVAAWSVGK